MLQKLVDHQANVFGDLPQQDWRDISSWMDGHGRAPAVLMPELLVRPTLTNLDETKRFEDRNDLTGLQDRNSSHVKERLRSACR